MRQPNRQTYDAWYFMGAERFGRMFADWRFTCPECEFEFSAADAANVGIRDNLQGRVCPVQLGGCGYPHESRFGRRCPYNRTLHGLIIVKKDGMPGGGYFPFAQPSPIAQPSMEADPTQGGDEDGADA